MSQLKEKLIESTIHSIIIIIISLLASFFIIINLSNELFMWIVSMVGVLFLLSYMKKKYKKEDLIIYSWVSLIFIIFIGNLVGKIIPAYSLISAGATLSVVDILSFTRFGSRTTNAKVMGNKKLMWKLIVYGKSFKNKNPVPTSGFGDYMFYTMLLSGIYKLSNSSKILFYGVVLIFIGCSINWIIIWIICHKKWYKGFPATAIPFVLILILILKIIN